MKQTIKKKPSGFDILNSTHHGSYFLCFEGMEGAGKTTQINKLGTYLESLNKTVHIFREPGSTLLGEKIREVLLTPSTPEVPIAINELSELFLFMASRAQLLREKILPILKNPNQVVILDRYLGSSFAYQGYGKGLGGDVVLNYHSMPPLNIFPHLTFYLSIDPKLSQKRLKARGHTLDRFESEELTFHEKVSLGYQEFAKLFKDWVKVIDGQEHVDLIFDAICANLNLIFKLSPSNDGEK